MYIYNGISLDRIIRVESQKQFYTIPIQKKKKKRIKNSKLGILEIMELLSKSFREGKDFEDDDA